MENVSKNLVIFIVLISFQILAIQITAFGQAMCDILPPYKIGSVKFKVVADGPNGYEPIREAKVELRKFSKKENEKDILIYSGKTDKDGLLTVDEIKKGIYKLVIGKEEWRYNYFRASVKVNKSKQAAFLLTGESIISRL